MADGSLILVPGSIHERERDVEAELRTTPGTTLADVEDALGALKLTAQAIVNLAKENRMMRLQGLSEYGQEPVASVAARLAEVFAEGANLKREAAGLLDAYVAEAVG